MQDNEALDNYYRNNRVKDCENPTPDKITDFLTHITNIPLESERKLRVISSKKGYIDFRYHLGKKVGLNDEQLKTLKDKLEKELPNGLYEF